MKKNQWYTAGFVILMILAGFLLFQMCRTTNQSIPSFGLETSFEGEYSQGGSEWKPFDEHTNFSGFAGDLVLRGQFQNQGEIVFVNFYLNHIGVGIYINGEEVYTSGRVSDDVPEMMCGSAWSGWLSDETQDLTDEILEIRLHNPHNYGNEQAYNEFLDSLYIGMDSALVKHLESKSMPYRVTGIFILVISITLLGTALGYFAQRLPSAVLLCSMGLMSLFMSGYFLLDTVDIYFRSHFIVFNTCVRQLCIMFAALSLVHVFSMQLTGKRQRIAEMILIVLGLTEAVLLILAIADVLSIYDTGMFWAIAQGIGIVFLLGLGAGECLQKRDGLLISGMFLLFTILLELVNARVGWWTSGIIVKTIFTVLLVGYLVRAVIGIATNHKESQKAKELAGELRNSRIVLAMSQIRTHFIFNVLTAISGMCEYAPEKADAALMQFSRYLRSNINIMQNDELEPFLKSLEHLKDYIALEQLRFGNKLQFTTELEVTEFKMPPLVLQPIVENAIRHGLFPKTDGGTIDLQTKTDGKCIYITITDDGVGFSSDQEDGEKKESVGLSNVRFRLQYMVNGRMDIESSLGKGTRVTIIIPCKNCINVKR